MLLNVEFILVPHSCLPAFPSSDALPRNLKPIVSQNTRYALLLPLNLSVGKGEGHVEDRVHFEALAILAPFLTDVD